MSNYGLCFLDPAGNIDTVEIIDCGNDEAAQLLARDRLQAIGKYTEVEVWARGQFVRLTAEDTV
jgi:hypothetical protein